MLRFSHIVPTPPAAGRRKLADPAQVQRVWLLGLALGAILVAILWPTGLGKLVDHARRQVVALGYLRQADAAAAGLPVRRPEALRSLQRALVVAPDDPVVAQRSAQVFLSLRAYREALPGLQVQARNSLTATISLGQCYLMSGRRAQGVSTLEGALTEAQRLYRAGRLAAEPYALILNNAGYVYAVAGVHLEEAQGLLTTAVNLQPQQPAYLDSLGWALYRSGDSLEAAFYLERAVRLAASTANAEMYYHLGAAQARLGRYVDAGRNLRRCLDLDPSWQEARQELRYLHRVLPAPTWT